MSNPGVGLGLVTTTASPRYTWTRNRLAVYGQFLLGGASGLNSVFPSFRGANSSDHSVALQLRGGIDRAVSRRLEVRVLEVAWLRTQLPNAATNVQSNLKFGAGMVLRLR